MVAADAAEGNGTMTVSEHDRIDILARRGETISLIMVETRPWSEAEAIRADLRVKILNYADYIRGDAFREQFGDAPAEIVLSHDSEPPEEIRTLLENATADLGIPVVSLVMPGL